MGIIWMENKICGRNVWSSTGRRTTVGSVGGVGQRRQTGRWQQEIVDRMARRGLAIATAKMLWGGEAERVRIGVVVGEGRRQAVV